MEDLRSVDFEMNKKICASRIFCFAHFSKDHGNRSRLNSGEHFVVIILLNVYDENA